MVNENYLKLMTENKKPVELVQELKDYEIKTSKLSPAARSKVIKKWGGGYVSEDRESYGPCRGYWPCGDSRCYDSNPHACKTNERFFVLYTACPSQYCFGRPNRPKYYWKHNNPGCGNRGSDSRDKISDEIRIRCPDCFNTTHMKHHKFRCSEHDTSYRSTSSVSFSVALAEVLGSEGLPREVFNKIINKIQDEPWDATD